MCAWFIPPFATSGAGLSLASRRAVARLGLGTTSWFRLLAKLTPVFSS